MIKALFYSLLVLAVSACASGHCNKQGKPDLPDDLKKILVFKYDGSKQCEANSGVSEKAMAKELSEIKVYSSNKMNDGQPRIQVCGALTGYANVYKIKAKNLPLAEALGFKKWDF